MQAKQVERATAELKLRLPEALRKAIEIAAKQRGVSLNTEMVERLDGSFGRWLFEEILRITYGPHASAPLIETYRHGMLRVKPEDKERMLASVSKFLDKIVELS
jgi:hypothetical protein